MEISNQIKSLFHEKKRLAEKAKHEFRMFKNLLDLVQKYFNGENDLRILEIGCGIFKQIPILLNAFGFSSVGIDNCSHAPKCRNHFEKILEKHKTNYFYKQLSRASQRKLKPDEADFKNADATSLPFQNEEFDLIYSHAVFEHILDIPKATSEMHRVLKKGGLANIGIHLFASISGSHHPLMWQHPVVEMPEGIEPWYHLRGLPGEIPLDLNRYREYQYQLCFEKFFEITEKIYHVKEGEHFITEEILSELSNFTRDELVKRNVIFNLRKVRQG